MKGFFDIFFGEETNEVIAKAGFFGAFVGALLLKSTNTIEKSIHFVIGTFTAIFLGPIICDSFLFLIKKYMDIPVNGPSFAAAIGFIVGRLGIKGLEKVWENLELNDFFKKLLLLLLKKK